MNIINYANDLLTNHEIGTDSIDINENHNYLFGGVVENKPTGGFPPIYLCKKEDIDNLKDESDKTKREYNSHKTAVSLSDIMKERRKKMARAL